MRPDGSIVWTLANLTFLRDEHDRPLCWVGQFQDITELRRMASRDPLTDALNRRAFDVELERARGRARCWCSISTASRTSTTPTATTRATSCCARPPTRSAGGCAATTCSARLGGDEFAVLLPHCDAARACWSATTSRR